VQGLRTVPDVAHSSWEVPEGTGVGESRNPSDLASYGLDPKKTTLRLKFRATTSTTDNEAAAASEAGLAGWEAILWRQRLYVSVTPTTMSNGSKEAFVSLLEYAEDVLEATHVVVCFAGKTAAAQPDEAKAIRNFMFLGFQPLAPGHEFMPLNQNLVCFYYTI